MLTLKILELVGYNCRIVVKFCFWYHLSIFRRWNKGYQVFIYFFFSSSKKISSIKFIRIFIIVLVMALRFVEKVIEKIIPLKKLSTIINLQHLIFRVILSNWLVHMVDVDVILCFINILVLPKIIPKSRRRHSTVI